MKTLLAHTKEINEQLARYGVKFGIYKDGTFNERLFPFDPVPRQIPERDFAVLEKGLVQRVMALNQFIYDIYHDKKIVKDGVVPEEFVYRSPGYLAQCENITPSLAKRGMLHSQVPEGVLRFLSEKGLLGSEVPKGSGTRIVKEEKLINIHNKKGGILIRYHHPADHVREGNLLAEIIDPYTTEIREKILAPKSGTIFFAHHAQLIAGHSIVFRLIV